MVDTPWSGYINSLLLSEPWCTSVLIQLIPQPGQGTHRMGAADLLLSLLLLGSVFVIRFVPFACCKEDLEGQKSVLCLPVLT